MIAYVTIYRRFNSLGLQDQISLVGHWLWLVGVGLAAGFSGWLNSGLLFLLLAWFVLIGLIGIAQAGGWRPAWLGWGLAALDLVLAAVAFLASGRFASPILSVFLLPLFGAGLASGWIGVLGSGAAVVLVVTAIGLVLARGGLWVMVPTGIALQALAVPALVIGWLTERIRSNATAPGLPSPVGRGRAGRSALEMFAIASRLSATLDFEQVLDLALDLSASVLSDANGGRDHLRLAVFLLDGGRLRTAAARQLPESDYEAIVQAEAGLLGKALAQGKTQHGTDPVTDPALRNLEGLQTCRDLLAIPLMSNGVAFGVLLFAHPRQGFFNSEQVELLEAASRQVAVAMQNARLFQDLEAERERMTEIEEEARRKLARDLHDGPTQSIAAITMRVNFARRLIERDADAATTELAKVEDLARRTTKDLRHMLFTLRPLILESQGLLPALRQLAEKTRDTHGQNVIVQAKTEVAEGLESGRQAVVFYIAEEAVNNARKHAEAEHIWVRLNRNPEAFTLEVEDDGVGFNVGAVDSNYEQRGSLGMVNMRERTELVDGKLSIRSSEGRGTLITVAVPLPSADILDPEPRQETTL
ncbi:MAG TPA: GAF domain-containing sensor histidine kinase [Anaerolineales bacterium]|nr:GAF domain-containing sensor histidine kinase [Anaerolineales bacterium]